MEQSRLLLERRGISPLHRSSKQHALISKNCFNHGCHQRIPGMHQISNRFVANMKKQTYQNRSVNIWARPDVVRDYFFVKSLILAGTWLISKRSCARLFIDPDLSRWYSKAGRGRSKNGRLLLPD